ncbi:hypothetical protein TNCV_4026851 [Trichonephila clavipes]|nr:hypothetical protein TNCV_4026851 [Trichonephila clavipes]
MRLTFVIHSVVTRRSSELGHLVPKFPHLAYAKTLNLDRFSFSHETYFLVQGFRPRFLRRSGGGPIREQHLIQTVKHPQEQMCFGVILLLEDLAA